MQSIVFVLVVYTHGLFAVPTTEFSTLEKCKAGIVAYEKAAGKATSFASGSGIRTPICVKIEK
jgi:hypothetical protein